LTSLETFSSKCKPSECQEWHRILFLLHDKNPLGAQNSVNSQLKDRISDSFLNQTTSEKFVTTGVIVGDSLSWVTSIMHKNISIQFNNKRTAMNTPTNSAADHIDVDDKIYVYSGVEKL
jgi:hypothetical protein